jgi:hypothetical protein
MIPLSRLCFQRTLTNSSPTRTGLGTSPLASACATSAASLGEELALQGGNSFFQALKASVFSTRPNNVGNVQIVDTIRGHQTDEGYEDTHDEAIDFRGHMITYLANNLSQVCEGDEEVYITNSNDGVNLLVNLSNCNFAIPNTLLRLMCAVCSVRSPKPLLLC